MINSFDRFSWLFFNIGVPVFAPVALLPLLNFSRAYRESARRIALQSVQEGQLLWVVISMCASACYEIGAAIGDADSDNTRALMLAGLLWHGMIIVVSSVIVLFASGDSAGRKVTENDDGSSNVRTFRWSLMITALISASYSACHFSLN